MRSGMILLQCGLSILLFELLRISKGEDNFEICSAQEQASILSTVMNCGPVETVIPLEHPPNDTYTSMKPTHVSVKRCEGSCFNNRHKSCIPTSSIFKTVDVLYFPRRMGLDGKLSPICSTVTVRDEISCICSCSVRERDCRDEGRNLRVYLPSECRCACRDSSRRSKCLRDGMFWNAQTCECMCKHPNSWPICPTGYSFDFNVGACHCVPPSQVASVFLEISLALTAVSGVIVLIFAYKYFLHPRGTLNFIASFRNAGLFQRMNSEDDQRDTEGLRIFESSS